MTTKYLDIVWNDSSRKVRYEKSLHPCNAFRRTRRELCTAESWLLCEEKLAYEEVYRSVMRGSGRILESMNMEKYKRR